MYIFISHAAKNEKESKRICEMLKSNGHTCFFAPQDLKSDKNYDNEMKQTINMCEAFLLVLSKASNDSEKILREIECAVSHCIPILVYQIEDVKLNKPLEYFLMSNQWIVGKNEDNYEKILEGIKNIADNCTKEKESCKKDQLHDSESKRNYKDIRKRGLEIIELVAVAALCIFMFLHERDTKVKLAEGDRVEFGTYLGEPIAWRVLQTQKNGETLLISENVLTFKAYNAADSGRYNRDDAGNDYWSLHETEADRDLELQAYVRGNSCWAESDIRTWLNSDEEHVIYDGLGPAVVAMSEMKNGYADEPGFLTGFTQQEKAAILPTKNVTNSNALGKEPIESTDLVWLLSKDELVWLKEANVNVYAKPTDKALEQDETSWYTIFSLDFGVDAYLWWLREPVPDKSSQCYMVDNGYRSELLRTMEVGVEGFGIRPVVRVNAKKIKFNNI